MNLLADIFWRIYDFRNKVISADAMLATLIECYIMVNTIITFITFLIIKKLKKNGMSCSF